MEASPVKRLLDRLKARHALNREKGVYGYMWWTAVKIVLIYIVTIVPLILLAKRFIDIEAIFNFITSSLSDVFVIVVFFISESFLGMIPPDLFVIWTAKFSAPFMSLLMLGVLSYAGGAVSYYIGNRLSKTRKIREYSERALDRYIKMVRKWGGAFIVISSLFPYSPFSIVVIAVSLLKYPFRLYLFFGLSRIIRFIVQGIFYLHILNLDKLVG
jgi:membrane protein YqaA with SNARE-associated domain